MPIIVRSICYKTFKSAVAGIRRRFRMSKANAQKLVGKTFYFHRKYNAKKDAARCRGRIGKPPRGARGKSRYSKARRSYAKRHTTHRNARWRIVCNGRTKSWHGKKSAAQHKLTRRMRSRGCVLRRVR